MINDSGGGQYVERQTQQGGDWFFWVAGLSLVNTLLRVMQVPFGFFFGLGATDFATRLGLGVGITLAVTAAISGIIALFGVFARRGARWAFLVGMGLYLLDALLCLWLAKYLEIAAHAYVLFRLFQGFQAAGQLAALRAQSASNPYGGYVPPSSTPSNDVWPPPPRA